MQNNYISLEKTLDSMEKNEVKKVKESPLKGILLILIAIICIFIPNMLPASAYSFDQPLMIMLSLIFILWGFITIMILPTSYVYSKTNQNIVFKNVFFDQQESDKLVNIITSGDYSEVKKLKNAFDRGVKLRLAFTKDRTLCYVQALIYIPFQYIIKTNAVQLSHDETNVLLDSIQ